MRSVSVPLPLLIVLCALVDEAVKAAASFPRLAAVAAVWLVGAPAGYILLGRAEKRGAVPEALDDAPAVAAPAPLGKGLDVRESGAEAVGWPRQGGLRHA